MKIKIVMHPEGVDLDIPERSTPEYLFEDAHIFQLSVGGVPLRLTDRIQDGDTVDVHLRKNYGLM